MRKLDEDWFVPGNEFLASGRDLLAKSLLAGSIVVSPGIDAIAFERPQMLACLADAEVADEVGPFPQPSLPGVGAVEQLSHHLSSEAIPIQRHIESMLKNAKLPNSWLEEGIEEPTEDCKYYTLNLLDRLSFEFGLIPYKVAVSKEGGMFAAYRHTDSGNIMRIEIDNKLDAVAVVSDGNRILDSGILESDDLEKGIVNAFNGSTPLAIEM